LRHPKRLQDEVRCTGPQRLNGGVQFGKRGDDDHLPSVALFAQFFQPRDPVFAGQRNVQNDQVYMVAAQPFGTFFSTAGIHHEVATRRQCFDEEVAHACFVIDDQDGPVGPTFAVAIGDGRGIHGILMGNVAEKNSTKSVG
jgi:hypothetical protein